MNSTILILTRDGLRDGAVFDQLSGLGYTTLNATPDNLPNRHQLDTLVMMLADDEEFLHHLLIRPEMPDHLPILYLGASEHIPAVLLENGNKLVDYLRWPTTTDELKAKLMFLQRVAKIGREHSDYLRDHENFLNWFSSHDGLTGLYNRHHFSKSLTREFNKAREHEGQLSLLFLDIDYFNAINRTCSHSFGDAVLNELSARVTRTSRDHDICFRYTGGNIVIIMPGAGIVEARKMANTLRQCCSEKPFSLRAISRQVTLSIGIASMAVHHPRSEDEFLHMAETALYQAKADGRNRSCVFSPVPDTETMPGNRNLETLKASISRLLEKTKTSAISSLQLLAKDIAGDKHQQHIDKAIGYTQILGKHLGLTPEVIQTLQNAVVLQSCIRLLMHKDLISKPEKLAESDRRLLKDLPYKLAEITEVFDYFDQERSILITRGENFDGSGFPDGLSGSEIPLGARIVNIIDSFTAMDEDRPFRDKLAPEAILEELKNEAGKQFDPFLVIKLLDIIEQNQLLELDKDKISQIREEVHTIHST